jgi:hypothetical protein
VSQRLKAIQKIFFKIFPLAISLCESRESFWPQPKTDIINSEDNAKRRSKMTTQSSTLNSSRIRPDIRAMLEYHILDELSLREACRRAGLPYHKNVSQHKTSKAGRAYVTQLKRRRRVILEFGVDDLALATLMEIRDGALKNGSHIAATRAHELCVREAAKAKAEGKGVGGKKDVDKMTRAEMIAEIQEINLKADGQSFDVDEDLEVMELRESLGMTEET